jgi:hypothetical protein
MASIKRRIIPTKTHEREEGASALEILRAEILPGLRRGMLEEGASALRRGQPNEDMLKYSMLPLPGLNSPVFHSARSHHKKGTHTRFSSSNRSPIPKRGTPGTEGTHIRFSSPTRTPKRGTPGTEGNNIRFSSPNRSPTPNVMMHIRGTPGTKGTHTRFSSSNRSPIPNVRMPKRGTPGTRFHSSNRSPIPNVRMPTRGTPGTRFHSSNRMEGPFHLENQTPYGSPLHQTPYVSPLHQTPYASPLHQTPYASPLHHTPNVSPLHRTGTPRTQTPIHVHRKHNSLFAPRLPKKTQSGIPMGVQPMRRSRQVETLYHNHYGDRADIPMGTNGVYQTSRKQTPKSAPNGVYQTSRKHTPKSAPNGTRKGSPFNNAAPPNGTNTNKVNNVWKPKGTDIFGKTTLDAQVRPSEIKQEFKYPRWAYKIVSRQFQLKKDSKTKAMIELYKQRKKKL